MNGNRILKYVLYDIIRNKWLITFTVILFLFCSGIIYFSKDITKSIAGILNVVLAIIPLACLLFGSIHYYNSREFIQMLLSQPVKRASIFRAEYLGLSISMSAAYLTGVIVPLVFFGFSKVILYLAIEGVFLCFIFTGIGMMVSIFINEKVKGVGLLLLIWLYFSVLYDGLILMLYFMFSDYPLEKVTIVSTFLNPVDISRILILLNLDISALLGYSGATFQKFFGNVPGVVFSFIMLILWTIIPFIISINKFKNKNF